MARRSLLELNPPRLLLLRAKRSVAVGYAVLDEQQRQHKHSKGFSPVASGKYGALLSITRLRP